ncbi:hypothetical protein H7849_17605 [Alloacidobacterium dinghuense]|uniref:Uncharacterized protein n=1 Tax=Alloacidobacterium dinghuense TaxID=2763107 RepID=A0A7G8BEE7_9BACT|nr:hypothetical protein [Alloacidobacterium dinghuense]QNI30917.1 hypothetical protein H7849_17605 [Alloacidobacterium dinghuense]
MAAVTFLALGTFASAPQYSHASGFAPQQQSTAASAEASANGAICNGEPSTAKRSVQSSSEEAGEPSIKDHLKLSTKTSSDENVDAQGQFCKREHKEDSSREASTENATPKAAGEVVRKPAPQPIAILSGGKLTIKAQGEDLSTVMNAVKAATGITIEAPNQPENERMYLDIGPAPVRDALVALLEGSNYNYLIQSSSENPQMAKRLVLTLRTSQATTTVASAQLHSETEEPSLYGGQGVQQDEQQAATAPEPQAPLPVQPTAIPSSVPTGINVQQMAAESHRSVGEVLNDLQKQQEQLLDSQAAAQQQSQPQQ